jgi:phosphoribosylaminoimidazolecarboxamide formyltransferase / IMP cyclohydrolase
VPPAKRPAPETTPPQGLVKVRTALLSVSDKTDLIPLAHRLAGIGATLISTGGTRAALEKAGLPTRGIEDLTSFPEMMDGRVKTLHPKVHGGLLAIRDKPDHADALSKHQITPIDLVCVNLYPFERTVANPDVALDEAIENIDIGGPAMIRSAAKNHRHVAVVTDPSQYDAISDELQRYDGATSRPLRESLAAAAFTRTAAYDTAISKWLTTRFG